MRYAICLILLLCAGCAPSPGPSATAQQPAAPAPQRPLVIAAPSEPRLLEPSLTAGVNNRDFSALTSAYLAYLTPTQQPMPYLAEELPTLEQGTWKLLPNGRMETTYRLRRNSTWHDGERITASDFVFAQRVHTDPGFQADFSSVERRMDEVRAVDEITLFIAWKEPFIWAGMVHGPYFAPAARHVLQEAYEADKDAFLNSPLLRDQFVGSGPYKIERWEPGSQLLLRAHDGYALGKPPIDHVLLKFIPDGNTIIANLLSGSVDVSFSSITFPQAQALEQAAWDGHVEYWRGSVRFIEFQTRDWGNLQPAVLDLRVRRAVMHSVDRQAIIELYAAKAHPLHFWMFPSDPSYPAIDRAVIKYEYDPARAEGLLREAGWMKGPDGVARNTAGEPLHMPVLNQFGAVEEQEGSLVLNHWKAVGITGELTQMTAAQDRDIELRSKFPGIAYNRRGLGYDSMAWTTGQITSPENRWAGQNRNGYANPLLEENYLKALATVDARAREPLFVEALKTMTSDAVVNPTHLQARPIVYRRGIAGPKETWIGEGAIVWNIREWTWVS